MGEKAETTFRRKVVKELKQLSNTVVFPIQQTAIHGTPDLLCSIAGQFVALELKANPTSHRIALQEFNLARVNRTGGHGFFVDPKNWPTIKEFLEKLSKIPITIN